VNDVS